MFFNWLNWPVLARCKWSPALQMRKPFRSTLSTWRATRPGQTSLPAVWNPLPKADCVVSGLNVINDVVIRYWQRIAIHLLFRCHILSYVFSVFGFYLFCIIHWDLSLWLDLYFLSWLDSFLGQPVYSLIIGLMLGNKYLYNYTYINCLEIRMIFYCFCSFNSRLQSCQESVKTRENWPTWSFGSTRETEEL